MLNLRDSRAGLTRCRLRLTELEFDVIHIAGIKQKATDELSSLPISVGDRTPLKNDFPLIAIEATHNLADVHIQKIDPYQSIIVSLNGNSIEVSLGGPPTVVKFLVEHAWETFCKTASLQVGCQASEHFLGHSKLLKRPPIIEKAAPIFFSESLLRRILYLS